MNTRIIKENIKELEGLLIIYSNKKVAPKEEIRMAKERLSLVELSMLKFNKSFILNTKK